MQMIISTISSPLFPFFPYLFNTIFKMAPNSSISQRSAVLALKSVGKMTSNEVSTALNLSVRQVNRIFGRACERGFDPSSKPPVFCDEFVTDLPRSGRPPKATPEIKKLVIERKRCKYFSLSFNNPTPAQEYGLQKGQTDTEAWIDTGDEGSEASVCLRSPRLDP